MLALEYPITRNFPWRFFTPLTLLFFLLLLIITSLFNAIAVGYEPQSFYADHYNPTIKYWWTPIFPWLKKSTICEPTRMRVRDFFTTEVGLFQYEINTLSLAPEGSTERKRVIAFPYQGTIFESCFVSRMFVTVVRPEQTVTFQALVSCVTENAQFNTTTHLDFSTYVERDTLLSREASEAPEWKKNAIGHKTFGPIMLAVQGLRIDALNVLFFDPASIPDPAHTRHWDISFEHCHEDAENPPECQQRQPRWDVVTHLASWSNGTTGSDRENPTSLAVIRNLVNAFSAAIHVDLGHPSPNNLFTNVALLQSALDVTYNANEARPPQSSWNTTVTESLTYTSPFAQRLRDNPQSLLIQLPIPPIEKTRIACNFLCQQWVRKSLGNFFASIFAATFSLVLAMWRGYVWFFGSVAREKPGGNNCNCRQCTVFPGDADHVPLFEAPPTPWHPDSKGSYQYKEPM